MEEKKTLEQNESSQEQQCKNPEEEINMEELLVPEANIEEGKIIDVKVVGKNPDGILVDLGLKSEGLIPKSEFESEEKFGELSIGSDIPVLVIKLQSREGNPVVSYQRAREIRAWKGLNDAFKNATPLEGVIKKKIKGGFMVDVGVEAFLPTSQLDLFKPGDVNKYMGQKYEFLVTEMNRNQQNIVLSRRKLLEIRQKKQRKELLEKMQEGDVVDGVVTRIMDFGAFVEIGGMEGLLHIGDISWQRLKKPQEVLSVRKNIRVKVLKIDKEKEKVSLGMKQLTQHPWENAQEKYPVQTVIKGKVTSITDFGVFVEIEPGLEGLLHVSEVSWTDHKNNVLKDFKAGQELELKVISIDREKEKLSLSLKRLKSNPWEEARLNYPPGTKIKGVVTNLTPFGAFVKLTEGIEGLIHIADMSWMKKVRHPQDLVKVKQEIEAVVLEVNPNNEKIGLSLKHLTEDPFKKYHAGRVLSGKVKRIVDFGAFVELEPGIEALLRTSEIGPKKLGHPSEALKAGETVEAKIIKSDSRDRKIDLSIKRLEHDRERALFSKYVDQKDRPTLGEVLEEE